MSSVPELFFQPDLTQGGETPDSHTVLHTFEIRPSQMPFGFKEHAKQTLSLAQAELAFTNADRRIEPGELIIRWHNLPKDSEVNLYFSEIDTIDIKALAMFRRSPIAFEVVDKHTLKLKVTGATWIPIPGGRKTNIPALLSVKLPDMVGYGQEFRISIHQVSGCGHRIIAAYEFRIPASKAATILEDENRKLSVFKCLFAQIHRTISGTS